MSKFNDLINLCDKYANDQEHCFYFNEESSDYKNCVGYITLDRFIFIWGDIYDALANDNPKLKIDLTGATPNLQEKEIDTIMKAIRKNGIDYIRMISY